MKRSGYADPWHHSLATELQALCKENLGLKLGRQHAIELIAACFGKKCASLFPSDTLVEETPDTPVGIDWDYVDQRMRKMISELTDAQVNEIKDILFGIWDEEYDEPTSLAKRLVRNIATNCDKIGHNDYTGAVLLTKRDWLRCCEVSRHRDFTDFMVVALPWRSRVPILSAKPDELYENRYSVEPGSILNVIAFLCPTSWEELLSRYHKKP